MIEELQRRHDAAIIVLYKDEQKTDNSLSYRLKGAHFTLTGLAAHVPEWVAQALLEPQDDYDE